MAPIYGHPDRRRRDRHRRFIHNLAGFMDHFHFFLGVAVFQEDIDLRQQVESDLIMFGKAGARQDICLNRAAFADCLYLIG